MSKRLSAILTLAVASAALITVAVIPDHEAASAVVFVITILSLITLLVIGTSND